MDVFVLAVLVVLVMSLPALSWWGSMSQRKRRIDEAADQRRVDFVTRNAGATGNHAPSPNRHARAASLAEQYFDDVATGSPPRRRPAHSNVWNGGVPGASGHPAINPATGLPMMNDAVDVAGNPFGSNLSDGMHHGTVEYRSSDSFDRHGLSGHSIGHDFHSGHDSFGHGSSWMD